LNTKIVTVTVIQKTYLCFERPQNKLLYFSAIPGSAETGTSKWTDTLGYTHTVATVA